MSDAPAALVHLVYAPLGPEPLRLFAESYTAHPAGSPHKLVIAMKGFERVGERGPWRAALAGIEHEELDVPDGGRDLGTYRLLLDRLQDHAEVCFTNSSSIVLADDWLGLLIRHLRETGVGVAGVAGSYESAYTVAPTWLRLRRRRDFPPFPNPHLRTNAFALRRELALALDWPVPRNKLDALRLESGKESLTRQILGRGQQVLVVGADGIAYPPELWQQSGTFRSGGQRNLMISDARTRQFETADPRRRERFAEMAWSAGG